MHNPTLPQQPAKKHARKICTKSKKNTFNPQQRAKKARKSLVRATPSAILFIPKPAAGLCRPDMHKPPRPARACLSPRKDTPAAQASEPGNQSARFVYAILRTWF